MIKKKSKAKAAVKKAKRSPAKGKKEANPADVRKEITQMVAADAAEMARAVIGHGKEGQLANVKYLFEVASIFPPAPDGTQATEEEDCLAKLLLERIKPPAKAEEVAAGEDAGKTDEGADETAAEKTDDEAGVEAADSV